MLRRGVFSFFIEPPPPPPPQHTPKKKIRLLYGLNGAGEKGFTIYCLIKKNIKPIFSINNLILISVCLH